MRLVADEGVDKPIVDALRAAGFLVEYFAEFAAGTEDEHILASASEPQSLLLTCDKDFGDLVFRQRLAMAGVVLIRLSGLSAQTKARVVVRALAAHMDEMAGAFTVIAPGLLRIRKNLR